MTQQVATCPTHPQREAIGICVRCRRRICSECTTKVEGINYCVGCLDTLASAGERQRHAHLPRLNAHVSATAYLALLCACVWLLLAWMLPIGPPP